MPAVVRSDFFWLCVIQLTLQPAFPAPDASDKKFDNRLVVPAHPKDAREMPTFVIEMGTLCQIDPPGWRDQHQRRQGGGGRGWHRASDGERSIDRNPLMKSAGNSKTSDRTPNSKIAKIMAGHRFASAEISENRGVPPLVSPPVNYRSAPAVTANP